MTYSSAFIDDMEPKDSHLVFLLRTAFHEIPPEERSALFKRPAISSLRRSAQLIESVRFIVYSRAAPQGSKRHLRYGILVESSKRETHSEPMSGSLQMKQFRPIGILAGTFLDVLFMFRRPARSLTSMENLTKSAPLYPIGRNIGDIDKLIRSVYDALTGVAYYDDSQVVDRTARKRFSDRDQTIIALTMSELTKALIKFHQQ